MGSCLTLYEDERKARLRSEEIDRQLEELAKQERGIIKILLLGAGESGKSTLVKQMKIIHNDGFTSEELRSFRPTVLDNLLSSMKYVLNGMGLLRINLETAKNKIHAQTILSCQNPFGECYEMPSYVSNSLQALWNDKGVRLAVARGYEYELNDSAIYLFENMDRLCAEKYIPTTTDVLRARVRTNGIIETHFKFNGIIFRMYDVGGQRSERQKWINCFAGIRALLFVVALSSYDMVLQEDQTVNRLHDSLNLFSQICNNRFFVTTSMILFLNKLDLFREKILYSGRHLRYYLPDYKGPDFNVDHGALFVQHTFLAQNRNPRKTIYPHFLTATDTSNVEIVFRAVMDAILFENLERYALLL